MTTAAIPTELDDLPTTEYDPTPQGDELPIWPTLQDYLDEYYQQLGAQGEGLKTYLKTFGDEYLFDKELEGLRGIVIIGGEPGSGKTALALQIAYDTAIDERPVLIYSFEMPKRELVTRFFQRAGKITYRKMQKKVSDLMPDDLTQLNKAKESIQKVAGNITIRETRDFFQKADGGAVEAVFDFEEQIQQINQITTQYGTPPLVVIDSLHEVPVEARNSRDLKQKIDFIMLNMRNLCDQTGATFLLISHQSRSGQTNGGLQSFMGSASIEYTVDMALVIAKPTKEGAIESDRDLTVAKNRYGPKPKASLTFDGKYMDFVLDDIL